MSARHRMARRCVCAAPIPYRDPGEPAACAKCGHRLAGEAAIAPDAVAAGAAGATAMAAHRGGQHPATTMSRDARERPARHLGLASPPTGTPFEWPFTPTATPPQGDRPLEDAG